MPKNKTWSQLAGLEKIIKINKEVEKKRLEKMLKLESEIFNHCLDKHDGKNCPMCQLYIKQLGEL